MKKINILYSKSKFYVVTGEIPEKRPEMYLAKHNDDFTLAEIRYKRAIAALPKIEIVNPEVIIDYIKKCYNAERINSKAIVFPEGEIYQVAGTYDILYNMTNPPRPIGAKITLGEPEKEEKNSGTLGPQTTINTKEETGEACPQCGSQMHSAKTIGYGFRWYCSNTKCSNCDPNSKVEERVEEKGDVFESAVNGGTLEGQLIAARQTAEIEINFRNKTIEILQSENTRLMNQIEACEQHNKILCNQKVELLQRISDLESLCDNVGELTKLLEEKDKSIADLESSRDQFSIGFADYRLKFEWNGTRFTRNGMDTVATNSKELLELYKQSLTK